MGQEYPGARIGPEPTTDRFNVVSYSGPSATCDSDANASGSGSPVVIPGNALVVDERMQFRALAKFGNTFLQRFQCSLCDAEILKV